MRRLGFLAASAWLALAACDRVTLTVTRPPPHNCPDGLACDERGTRCRNGITCYGESHHIISVVPRGLRCGTGMGETECELTVPPGTTIHLSITGSAARCALRDCVIEPAVESSSCSVILMERDETLSLGGCLRD